MPTSSAQAPWRVFFVSTSAGAGHNQAAAALLARLKEVRPEVAADFADALEFVPAWFRRVYAGTYETMVTRLPRFYGLAYDFLNRPKGPRRRTDERVRLAVEWTMLARLRREVLRRRPVLVVATHYLAMPMIGSMIASGTPDLRLLAVVTDHEAHRWWFAENVERYFVANEDVARAIQPWGIPPERITVSGIPIHPKWTAPLDRRAIYRDWRLPEDRPIVILSGGTFFTVGPVEEVARGIVERTEAHVVVLAGRNKRLLARIAALARATGRITPVPFTLRVQELAEVGALIVTKAGGLMTSECVAKGLPMVLTKPIPGQEAANAEMLVREGAAVLAPRTADVVAEVARLLKDPAACEALRANARRLYRPATETIVAAIAEAVDS